MAFSHVVYIDEAGDEGFGKLTADDSGGQSRWLLLGAAIVGGEYDPSLPALKSRILARFPEKRTPDLHFRKLKHEQKVVVSQEIAAEPIGVCIAFSHKITLPGSRWAETFKRPGYLYNFLTRWLLERVTSHCAEDARTRRVNGRIKVVFSRRGGTNYSAMHDYMLLMRDGREVMRPVRSIDWSVFDPDDIVVENHSKWAGLQIADATTSAFFAAVEPNGYGNHEPRYAEILRDKAIRNNGSALNCGVTPVPGIGQCRATPAQLEFFRSFAR